MAATPDASATGITTLAADGPRTTVLQQLREKFVSMMQHLHLTSQGARLAVSFLEEPATQDFISTHASILDSSFAKTAMTDIMRQQLQQSDYIFSGIKTFHELNEAFPSLIDENGNRKPFEQFLNDVRKIDEKYNSAYLKAEYNFCQQSANMAAKWEQYQKDGDRYNLQYRTAGDDHVRPAHAALDRITLPPSHPFWQQYFPPNGWNCRCTVVQVRKSKYPVTPDSEVQHLIEQYTSDGSSARKEDMFRFNPGMQKKTVPDYNAYTIRRCQDCDIAKAATPNASATGITLAAFVPENELCQACQLIRVCQQEQQKKVAEDLARLAFEAYSSEKWKHSYFSKKGFGFVVTERQRLLEATASPNEIDKFRKEYRMCRVAADNGYEVQFLRGNGRKAGQTYDILLDSAPTDLKSTGSMGNLVKHIKKAYKKQGAKAVLLELESHDPLLYDKLNEAKRKYNVSIYFYFKDDKRIRKM